MVIYGVPNNKDSIGDFFQIVKLNDFKLVEEEGLEPS